MMRNWILSAVAVAAMTFAPSQAKAGLVPIQVSVMPDAGMYRFTYAVALPTDAVLRPGDYFTIYNFDGFVAGSAVSNGSVYSNDWSFSSANLGPTPDGVGPTDDPSIPNLTWTYTGPVINLDASLGSTGKLLGAFPVPEHDELVVHGKHRHRERADGQQHYPDHGSCAVGSASGRAGTGNPDPRGSRASPGRHVPKTEVYGGSMK